MRRFSQRNSLVTLSDINITPLLDLAFVLLIIFIITTPAITQSLTLNLPTGGKPERQQRSPKDLRTVEISAEGAYRLDRKAMSMDQIETELVKFHQTNTNMVVIIRADSYSPAIHVLSLVDRCKKNNINLISFAYQPPKRQ